MDKSALVAALGLLFCGFASVACGQIAAARYSVISLGTLGGKTSRAFAINDAGQIAGSADTAAGKSHAFLFSDGKMLDLGTLGGGTSEAHALNAPGQVVGDADLGPGLGGTMRHAFLFDHGKMLDLGTLGGSDSRASGINDSGTIVGTADVDPAQLTLDLPRRARAFEYSGGKMHALGDDTEIAASVNNAGQIAMAGFFRIDPNAGTTRFFIRAAIYKKGEIEDLGTPLNRVSSAKAINASGQVAGTGVLSVPGEGGPNQSHAFLYMQGTSQDLGTLGGETSRAFGISDSGMVVGSADSEAGKPHAFLFDGNRMLDLNALVDSSGLTAAGFEVLTSATRINNRGQIVGLAKNGAGQEIGYLLTPVGESKAGP